MQQQTRYELGRLCSGLARDAGSSIAMALDLGIILVTLRVNSESTVGYWRPGPVLSYVESSTLVVADVVRDSFGPGASLKSIFIVSCYKYQVMLQCLQFSYKIIHSRVEHYTDRIMIIFPSGRIWISTGIAFTN